MKLELYHLAPYLPYNLQMNLSRKVVWYPNINERPQVKGADATLTTSLLDDINKGVYDSMSKFKPLLRPLSDLTKEIEHNGEKFVPIIELCKTAFPNRSTGRVVGNKCLTTLDTFFYEPGYGFISYQTNGEHYCGIPRQPELFQKLFEWHFDLFSLIDNGLAIDINTITP